MNLKFTHGKKEIAVMYSGTRPGRATLYAVPTDYSADGYFVATWQDGEIEPMPACAVEKAVLLCVARIESDKGGLIVKTIENKGAVCNA